MFLIRGFPEDIHRSVLARRSKIFLRWEVNVFEQFCGRRRGGGVLKNFFGGGLDRKRGGSISGGDFCKGF